MKYLNALLVFLLLLVPAVQAQECPPSGTLAVPLELFLTPDKHHASAGNDLTLASGDLTGEGHVVCMAGNSSSANDPFSSSIEEIWQGNAWALNTKTEIEYNDDGRLATRVSLRWNAGTQEYLIQNAASYTYDANGNVAEILTQTWNGSGYTNQYLDVFEKDVFGNDARIERFDWENGAWKTRFLSESVIEDGHITETTVQTIHALGILANVWHRTFEYDAQGREIVKVQERWNEGAQSWDLDERDLTTYPGANVVTMNQVYEGGGWVDYLETTQSYVNGLLMEEASVGQMQSVAGNRVVYTYDNAGNLTALVFQGEGETGGWVDQSRSTFTLDPDGNLLVLLIQFFDNDAMMWMNISRVTYEYEENSEATSIEEMIPGVTAFDVFPYPAQDQVHVQLQLTQASALKVEVFDVLGRLVKNLADGMGSSGVQRLSWLPEDEPAGLYFVRLTVDGAVETKPIVLIK